MNHARNVVALGEMEHDTAKLFELGGRVFGLRSMSFSATVEGLPAKACPGATATSQDLKKIAADFVLAMTILITLLQCTKMLVAMICD